MESSLSRILLLVVAAAVGTLSHHDDSPLLVIYLTDQGFSNGLGSVFETNSHHFNFTAVPLKNVSKPRSIDFDRKRNFLYWTDFSLKQIKRSAPDGSQETLVAQLNQSASPNGLTLDGNTKQVFFTDMGNDVIVRIEMDGFKSTTIVNTGLSTPMGIVADTKNRKLYWVDKYTKEKIESCDYDGQGRRTVVEQGVTSPNGITIDQEAGRLYWADGLGIIGSVLVDGTDMRRVYTEHGVVFNDIIFYNSFLYMTMLNIPFLVAMPEDGSSLMILRYRRFQYPFGVHIYSPNVTMPSTCAYGEYGENCVKCGRCIDGDYCEKTTGLCLAGCAPGYKGDRCMEQCAPYSYGEECKSKCGKCKIGGICNHETGKCPTGCQSGYKGDNCLEVCGDNTFGDPCQDCGYCAEGAACNGYTGECPFGCTDGWQGKLCKTKIPLATTPKPPTPVGTPIGLIVGLTVGLTLAIIVIAIIVAILVVRHKRKASDPETYVELDEPRAKDSDYTTLGNVSKAGIAMDSQPVDQPSATGYDNVMVSPVWDTQNEGDSTKY